MVSKLSGKTALVTGAARGIGQAIALRLAEEGAQVAVHYGSSADAAEQLVESINTRGGSAFAIQATLGIPGDADTLWRGYDQHADGVDIVVNNAGILGAHSGFENLKEHDFDSVFSVNTRAPFFIVQGALERIRDHGRIINISTSLTHGSRNPDLIAYSMSKAAMDAFTATLAKQLGPRNITVNAVGPGAINSDMNASRLSSPEIRKAIASRSPFRRVGETEDVADVVSFLASSDSRWVTGQWIDASGGALL